MLAALVAAGCNLAQRDKVQICLPEGYVYYLDGAGGGNAILNWSSGVKEGLQAAGYNAFGEMFDWETGLGPMADAAAGADYMRSQARQLVTRIATHRQACPEPAHLIALSAGTAVAVYALESLNDDNLIGNVVLLGSSVSADHDLTAALRHVRGKLYIFTSNTDAVLGFLIPLTGTAGHEPGEPAGLGGFNLPLGATAETRRLYAEKVVTIRWTQDFERAGNYGGHLDNVNAQFVRDHVAPLIMGARTPGARTPGVLRQAAAQEKK